MRSASVVALVVALAALAAAVASLAASSRPRRVEILLPPGYGCVVEYDGHREPCTPSSP